MTNQTCSFSGCTSPRHVTKSGNIRGYCKAHEAFASRKSRSKFADEHNAHEGECNEACMNAQPDSPCECSCNGQNHAVWTLTGYSPVYHNDGTRVG